jgi:DNA polymerase elongation subunit (family B)
MQLTDLSKILFLDIETVPVKANFEQLEPELAHLWEDKFDTLKKRMPEKYSEDTTAAEAFANSAGIYSEFGKIICISVGSVYFRGLEMHFRTKSFYGHDEKKLLEDFGAMLTKFFTGTDQYICGHNIKEFDIPYICRRILINRIKLPAILNISGKKPWEINLLDTLELWRFGDYKNYTPLKLLTAIFGIPTPKDDIDGSRVAAVYYGENDIERIARYCQKDVIATALVFMSINGFQHFKTENIEYV